MRALSPNVALCRFATVLLQKRYGSFRNQKGALQVCQLEQVVSSRSSRRGRGAQPRHGSLRRGGVRAFFLALALARATLAAGAGAAKDDLDLVSRAGGGIGAKSNNTSVNPAISDDGRFVA